MALLQIMDTYSAVVMLWATKPKRSVLQNVVIHRACRYKRDRTTEDHNTSTEISKNMYICGSFNEAVSSLYGREGMLSGNFLEEHSGRARFESRPGNRLQ
jgi:hypothetical protein